MTKFWIILIFNKNRLSDLNKLEGLHNFLTLGAKGSQQESKVHSRTPHIIPILSHLSESKCLYSPLQGKKALYPQPITKI